VGQGFDIAMGNRVAQGTASDLLHRIKDAIEQDYQADEAGKEFAVRHAPSEA
jgi:hypothetical protein